METTLRPLRLGELLDRCFRCYRNYFWLFVGILAIPMAILAAAGVVYQSVIWFSSGTPGRPLRFDSALPLVVVGLYIIVVVVVDIAGYAAAQGAATHALSRVYLGRRSSIASAYRGLKGRYGALVWLAISIALRVILFFIPFGIGIAIIAMGARSSAGLEPIGGIVAVGGAVLGVYLSLPYVLAIPAFVVEDIRPRVAIDRSTVLAQGYRWQLLLISILMGVITWVVAIIITFPFTVITGLAIAHKTGAHPMAQVVLAGISPFVKALTAPLFVIGYTMAYYDRRVRQEGLDLDLLIDGMSPEPDLPPGTSSAS
ncbi:MAG: hypothetical protein ACRD3D_06370 [Terriglobia bacterium]